MAAIVAHYEFHSATRWLYAAHLLKTIQKQGEKVSLDDIDLEFFF
jgi:hypothetical protein